MTVGLSLHRPSKRNLSQWVNTGRAAFELLPTELLGAPSERLQRLKLVPPTLPQLQHSLAQTAHEQYEQARTILNTLRASGLPVGISGLQTDSPRLLAEMCLSLLSDHSDFNALWIVSKKRKESVQQTLFDALKTSKRVVKTGQIVLCSPDELNQQLADTRWGLIILQDLDQILPSANFARAYQLLRRQWTVATFANRQWHESEGLTGRVLQAFQLENTNLNAFLKICHHAFADQRETLIQKIVSPFRRIAVDTADDSNAVRIPPRETARPIQFQPQPVASIRIDRTAPGSTYTWEHFIQRAEQLAARSGAPVEPVPFMRYYPTYDDMTPEQLRWYLYWRDQYRHGNPISTDLSYLFVHIYEGLNVIGFARSAISFRAFGQLVDVLPPFAAEAGSLPGGLAGGFRSRSSLANRSA